MTYDLEEATRYLKSGGLGEVIGMTDFARAAASPKVQMDTDMAMALCIMATAGSFQANVGIWMRECFGTEISADKLERGDRLLEEVFELLQSGGYPRERIRSLENYVYSRPVGEPSQEVGGVMTTLAAYCLAHGLDMHAASETELARCWSKIDAIRAKQAAKPTGSALPIAEPAADLQLAGTLEYVGTTSRGYTIFRQPNGVGGHLYWSDEIGGGVRVWDTCLVADETLKACLAIEAGELPSSKVPTWRPASEAPSDCWLVTYRAGEKGWTRSLRVTEQDGSASDEWCAPDGRSTITHHSYAAPTHFLDVEIPELPAGEDA